MADTDEVVINHVQRRKIEGRVLIPFIQALRERFGDAATYEVVDETIRRLATEDGTKWAAAYGQSTASLRQVAEELWAGGGGMEVRIINETEDHLDFDITRCRYAEFYQDMGLAELGTRVLCNRDRAMLAGFNSDFELSRSQTIMEGASHCDFRFRKRP